MESIHQYIDNVFAAFPQSEKVDRLKENLLADSLQRYSELVGEGRSPAEALGLVVQHFGSVEDIRAELGLPLPTEQSLAEARQMAESRARFKRFQPRFAIALALAAVLVGAGIALAALLSHLSRGVQAAAFFLPMAAAAAIATYASLRYDALETAAQPHGQAPTEPGAVKARRRYRLRETLMGVTWLAAIIIYLLLGFLLNWWHPGWLIFLLAILVMGLLRLIER